MMMTLIDIQSQLEAPFAIADIDLLPKGKSEQGGKVTCMALPYADVRVYEDRLNQLASGEWSTPPPMAIVVGQKLVVYVSVIVCGIVHTDVGEAAAGGENAATESWAQGFKRACSQFGLGRYLYDLEKAWVPYNAQRKQIDLNASQIQNVVRKMYSAAGIGVSTVGVSTSAVNEVGKHPQPVTSSPTATPANLSTVPTVRRLHEMADLLSLEWDAVLLNAFDKPIKDGKVTYDALKKKGDELPPGYCQRLASYLQSLQAA